MFAKYIFSISWIYIPVLFWSIHYTLWKRNVVCKLTWNICNRNVFPVYNIKTYQIILRDQAVIKIIITKVENLNKGLKLLYINMDNGSARIKVSLYCFTRRHHVSPLALILIIILIHLCIQWIRYSVISFLDLFWANIIISRRSIEFNVKRYI